MELLPNRGGSMLLVELNCAQGVCLLNAPSAGESPFELVYRITAFHANVGQIFVRHVFRKANYVANVVAKVVTAQLGRLCLSDLIGILSF
ncbi:hypothetical protein PVK06_037307 [Gossypium arboreum]|uniref:RNase H type-1 domain-containing protein n=1 Tax=Gossypium arboreum TaxID=29729 RepID=A0ABR0MZ05_GOSAR|nr:hypothetical protein PVK06_037307 [Gossypium arboreum]